MSRKQLFYDRLNYLMGGAAILTLGAGVVWAIVFAADGSHAPLDRWLALGLVVSMAYLWREGNQASEVTLCNLKSAVVYYKYDMVRIEHTDNPNLKHMIGQKLMVAGYDQLSDRVELSSISGNYFLDPGEIRLVYRSKFGQKIDADNALGKQQAEK